MKTANTHRKNSSISDFKSPSLEELALRQNVQPRQMYEPCLNPLRDDDDGLVPLLMNFGIGRLTEGGKTRNPPGSSHFNYEQPDQHQRKSWI